MSNILKCPCRTSCASAESNLREAHLEMLERRRNQCLIADAKPQQHAWEGLGNEPVLGQVLLHNHIMLSLSI